jgi:heptosyltransferase-2
MVKSLGFKTAERRITLEITKDSLSKADEILSSHGIGTGNMLVGIAPGATYGPAKMWFPERFAAVSDHLREEFSSKSILFGSKNDRERADLVKEHAKHTIINLAGETNLNDAISLIARCDLFVSNDSGLMHLAGALGVSLVAIFGSTNPVTTSPVGEKSIVIYKNADCSPCLKKTCPTDFKCMDMIGVDDVFREARILLEKAIQG